MRTNVTLLKHMDSEASCPSDRVDRTGNFATISEHDNICKVALPYDIAVPLRQVFDGVRVIPATLRARVDQVSATKIDPPNPMSARTQRGSQPAKKRGSRTLQDEKGALHVKASRLRGPAEGPPHDQPSSSFKR